MKSIASRSILVLLAVLLHGLVGVRFGWYATPSLRPQFQVPAKAQPPMTAPFYEEALIDPDSSLGSAHVASLCELPGGRLAAAWYAGSEEGAKDVAIYFANRPLARGGSWSKPRAIVTRESAMQELNRYIKKVGNSVIFSEPDGKLWLIYVTTSLGGWSCSSLNVKTSVDGGQTWTASQRLTLSPIVGLSELVKNRPLTLSDGSWLVPVYHEFVGKFPELLWLQTHSRPLRAAKTRIVGGRSLLQPAVVPLTPTTALAFFRDSSPRRQIAVARSLNGGRDWSAPQALNLPNPDAGLEALRLADGRLLLFFNDTRSGRENLRLAVSEDDGQSWQRRATLAEEIGDSVSYPFALQTSDANVHLVYTWRGKTIKHVTFNPAWLNATN